MPTRAPKSGRIELRTDRAREKRIRLAASIAKKSVSAFMLEAAAERAEEVIAAAHEVAIPATYFDAFWESLSKPPKPNRRLLAAAKHPLPFVQRP